MRLAGKKALVTGASRGIGRAIALAFAEEGADVAVTARRAEALQEVAREIAARGRRVHALVWDVRDVAQVDARLAEVREKLGGLDIVVNNAGVLRGSPEFPASTAEELWDYTLDTNLKGLVFLCQGAVQQMREQKHGVIINIASDIGFRGTASAYGVSKWGVVGFTRGLARECAPHGIRVNGIAPGPVATEMINWQPGQSLEAPDLPLGRLALPEEVARVAVFLASDDAAAVFGESIVLNSANP
jgi:NAD(P)-dependent dehydrogenase (short-subunit alcohol dehydrogenase family)